MRRIAILLGALLCVQVVVLLVVLAVVASRPKAPPVPTATATSTPTVTPTWTRAPTNTPTPTITPYVMTTNSPTPAPVPSPTYIAVRALTVTDQQAAAQAYLAAMEPLLADLTAWGEGLTAIGDVLATDPYAACDGDYEALESEGRAVIERLAEVEVPQPIVADHEAMANALSDGVYHLTGVRVALCERKSEYLATQELEGLMDSEAALSSATDNISAWLSTNQ